METIEAHLLFEMHLEISDAQVVGVVPNGLRDVVSVRGSFEGEELKGTIISGGDWGKLRSDNTPEIDARMSLKTHDDELIYLHYVGLGEIPEAAIKATKPGEVPGGVWKLKVAMWFETASQKHARLNRILAIGIGTAETSKGKVKYKVYAPA